MLEKIEKMRDEVLTPERVLDICEEYGNQVSEEINPDWVTRDLYLRLIELTEGDAQRTVRDLGRNQSLEAYRQLNRQATAATTQQVLDMRNDVQRPRQAKTNEEILKAINTWKGVRR